MASAADPPIVLWSLARRSLNLRTFLGAGHFAVNVVAADNRIGGGDHVIFLGRAARFRHADKEPLIYHAGRYSTPAGRD